MPTRTITRIDVGEVEVERSGDRIVLRVFPKATGLMEPTLLTLPYLSEYKEGGIYNKYAVIQAEELESMIHAWLADARTVLAKGKEEEKKR